MKKTKKVKKSINLEKVPQPYEFWRMTSWIIKMAYAYERDLEKVPTISPFILNHNKETAKLNLKNQEILNPLLRVYEVFKKFDSNWTNKNDQTIYVFYKTEVSKLCTSYKNGEFSFDELINKIEISLDKSISKDELNNFFNLRKQKKNISDPVTCARELIAKVFPVSVKTLEALELNEPKLFGTSLEERQVLIKTLERVFSYTESEASEATIKHFVKIKEDKEILSKKIKSRK